MTGQRQKKEIRERRRLLAFLAKENAELEWPCHNQVMRKLIILGYVARKRDYISAWGGRDHAMVTLAITPAGRKELETLNEGKSLAAEDSNRE